MVFSWEAHAVYGWEDVTSLNYIFIKIVHEMVEKDNKKQKETTDQVNEGRKINSAETSSTQYREVVISAVKENCRIGENFEKYGDILQAIENYEYALFLLECLRDSHLKLNRRKEDNIDDSYKIRNRELKVIDKSDPKHKKLLEDIKEEYALRIEIMKKVNVLTEQI